LTTILYLMSLTEEARAPFSLVDEINQVRHPPLLSWLKPNSDPVVFFVDNSREWINELNEWYTIQWSMWPAKLTARNTSWSHPSCCLTWCITKGWRSCAWITGSGCLMIRIWARWWIWLMDMLQAGEIKGNVGLDHVGLSHVKFFVLFFFRWWERLLLLLTYVKIIVIVSLEYYKGRASPAVPLFTDKGFFSLMIVFPAFSVGFFLLF
jgi:hypothetical protein